MIIGRIVGKTSTTRFKFEIEGNAKKFQYIQAYHKEVEYVLAQILEIEKDKEKAIADCLVIGYRDNNLKQLRTPLEPGAEILNASDDFIKETLNLTGNKNSAYIGTLEGREKLKVYIDLNKLLTKHVCILAKSGSGKSYSAGVLLEEILEKNIPILIIDPHNEYSSLKYPTNDNKNLEKFDIKPKGFLKSIQTFSPDIETNPECKPLKLNKNFSASELVHLLPARLSNQQLGTLYSCLKNFGNKIDFDELIFALESEDNNTKWNLINILEYVKKLNIFSESYTSFSELIQPGKASIINLRGINPEVSEVVVYKLLKDLFIARKTGKIPPFFLVLEEAHNFIPERNYGEAKSSPILRQIFSEGRKFGLGACLISQRPSRVEKTALSQITTQIILKITNPNDLKAVSNSVEGITYETEKEIKNLAIGTALITGLVDMPLFVNIRPRKTEHGGKAVDILNSFNIEDIEEEKDFLSEIDKEILPLIKQKISVKDYKIINDVDEVKISLIPCLYLTCSDKTENFNILVNLNTNELVNNFETGSGIPLEFKLPQLSPQQEKVFKVALLLKKFTPADLFSKSGVQFSAIFDIVNLLVEKGYFIRDKDIYRLNENLDVLSKLKSNLCFEEVDFSKINYLSKLEKNFNESDLRTFLGKFIKIENFKECFLIVYK